MNGIDAPQNWRFVHVAFVVAVFGWGIGFYGVSVYLPALHDLHGWSISTISAAITAHYLVSALLIAGLPEAYRRFGVRRVTTAGAVLTAAGALAWANVQAPWQLLPALVLSGAGWSAMSGAALNAMVAPWFERDRPKAMSFAFNGASVGGLLFVPLWAALIATLGLPWSAAIMAVAAVVIVCPLAWHFLRYPARAVPVSHTPPAAPSTRRALLSQPAFVTISVAFALGLFAQIGLVAHLIVRLEPIFGKGLAALAISLITLCAILGRSLLAQLIGDHDRRIVAAANLLIQAMGTVLLVLGDGPAVLLVGCVLFGLGFGNLTSLPPLIAQHEFQAADVGTVVALVTAINQAVFAFAPGVFGVLRDLTDSYSTAFLIAATAQVAAAAIVARGHAATRAG